MQQEALTLRRIVGLLRDQQLAIAKGATTGEFDQDDSARHQNLERALTNELHAWCLLRQEFQRSPEFLRTALVNEIWQLSTDVDAIVQQNDLAGILTEVCQALQEGESGQHELTTTTAPTTTTAAMLMLTPMPMWRRLPGCHSTAPARGLSGVLGPRRRQGREAAAS